MKNILIGLALAAGLAGAGELQDIQKDLARWQKAFQAEDIKVQLHVIPMGELLAAAQASADLPIPEGALLFGMSTWDIGKMTGEMWVVDRASYTPEVLKRAGLRHSQIALDQEDTVVHELCHLLWDYAPEERGVTLLADLLTHIKRTYPKTK